MPYVDLNTRVYLNHQIVERVVNFVKTELPNDDECVLEFLFFVFLYIIKQSYPKNELRYYTHNEIVGMLTCCWMEFERVVGSSGSLEEQYEFSKVKNHFKKLLSTVDKKYFDLSSKTNPTFTPGALNYSFTAIVKSLFPQQLDHKTYSEITQEKICSMLYTLQNYWYSQKTAAYEDKKIRENGQVNPIYFINP